MLVHTTSRLTIQAVAEFLYSNVHYISHFDRELLTLSLTLAAGLN